MKILIVEDEKILNNTINKSLKDAGYEVESAFDGFDAMEMIEIESYDLIVLDLNLPNMDGMEILKNLRKEDVETKVLILSARSQIQDKVEGLDAGANDFLQKPFHLDELKARVRSLTRRNFIQNNTELSFDKIKFDSKNRTIFIDDKELKKFPTFNSKDFDGNDVTKDIFKDKKLTLVNFWFNGCAPCVGELPKLQQLNDEIEKMGGQVIGINSEAKVGEENTIKEAKKILEKQGAKYKNITIDKGSELEKYTETIMSYPTSILVDSEGNIVGDPIVGAIDKEDKYKEVKEMIEKIIKDKM